MTRRGHREGTIYKRPDGRWEAQMSVSLASGQLKRKSFYGKSRRDVALKLTAAQSARDLGLPVVGEEQTVAQYVASWLRAIRPPILEARTWAGYEQLMRCHVLPTLGSVRLARLTPQQVQDLYSLKLSEGLASTTVNHLHRALHRCLESALRLDLVVRNVAGRVDAPKLRVKEMRPFTAAQAQQLLTWVATQHDPLEAYFVLSLSTGMREGELLGLRWQDLDLDAPQPSLQVRQVLQRLQGEFLFKVPKTARSRRRIALTAHAVACLRTHRERQDAAHGLIGSAWGDGQDRDLVFPNELGGPLMHDRVRKRFRRLLREAQLPSIRLHDLRHTCATVLLGRRVNPKVVSEMLGHASIAITLDIYSHVLPDMQQDAAAVLEAALAPGVPVLQSVLQSNAPIEPLEGLRTGLRPVAAAPDYMGI